MKTTIDEEVVERLPPEPRALYLAFRDLYTRTGGDVEVFVEGFEQERDDGELIVRASNVHGQGRFVVDEHGRLADFEWHGQGGES